MQRSEATGEDDTDGRKELKCKLSSLKLNYNAGGSVAQTDRTKMISEQSALGGEGGVCTFLKERERKSLTWQLELMKFLQVSVSV